jgi:hypothetical protein
VLLACLQPAVQGAVVVTVVGDEQELHVRAPSRVGNVVRIVASSVKSDGSRSMVWQVRVGWCRRGEAGRPSGGRVPPDCRQVAAALSTGQPYADLGQDYYTRGVDSQAHTRRLNGPLPAPMKGVGRAPTRPFPAKVRPRRVDNVVALPTGTRACRTLPLLASLFLPRKPSPAFATCAGGAGSSPATWTGHVPPHLPPSWPMPLTWRPTSMSSSSPPGHANPCCTQRP